MTDHPERETRTVHDPFLGKTVEVSNRLTDRLRGHYACGPTQSNGVPEFGWHEYPTPPIQREAADEIERLCFSLSATEKRAEELARQLGECSGGYETLEKELAEARSSLARVVEALKPFAAVMDWLADLQTLDRDAELEAFPIIHAHGPASGGGYPLPKSIFVEARSALHRSQG